MRGFTRHPSSGVAEKTRGTYAGLIEKIPYLQELGITAVELLPVFHFDPQDCPPGLTTTSTKLIIVFRRETVSDLLKEDERTLCLNLPSASAG